MFTFCPLQGAFAESSASQSLLELDGGVKVLVGLGWDESFDTNKLQNLEKHVQNQSISLILLTHATVGHLAAFAHCCKNFPRFTQIPVYATRPVIDLGRTLVQDLYDSTPLVATTIPETSIAETSYPYAKDAKTLLNLLLQPPTADEIAKYFSLIQPLKYSQPHQPLPTPGTPPLNGLTITAYNSGRTLGGTIWHIQHGMESIVYAVEWNQARENVFAGAAWLGGAGGGGAEVIEQLRKPTALICSSRGADKTAQTGSRAKRDEQLVDMIKFCVARGGTALIPVDSSARVLELAYLLEHAWRNNASNAESALKSAKLYLAGKNMSSTIRYARTMLEWMDDNINRELEAPSDTHRRMNGSGEDKHGQAGGPFDFRYLRVVEKRGQVERLLSLGSDNVQTEGRVILASDSTMEWGFSKDLFRGLARDSRNLVIITETPRLSDLGKPSLVATLWNWWKERKDGVSVEQVSGRETVEFVYGGGREIEVQDASRQALEGEDLALYQQWLAQRQFQTNIQAGVVSTMEAVADVADDVSESSSESEGSDSEQQGKALNISTTIGQASRRNVELRDEDLGINIVTRKKGVFDFDVDNKRGRDRFFPLSIRRKRLDDCGETIRPEAYLRAEERDADGQDGLNGLRQDDTRLGKKRRWDDIRHGKNGPNKRLQPNRNVSDEADIPNATDITPDEFAGVEEMEEAPILGPSRLQLSTEKIMVNLRIAFVDFTSIHDKRSLNMLIPLIQPRKMILVGGNREETLALAADCNKLLAAHRGTSDEKGAVVLTPEVGTTVDASVDTNAWALRLADALVRKIKWQQVKGLSVATINGQLLGALAEPDRPRDPESSPNKRQKTESDTDTHTASTDPPTTDAAGEEPRRVVPTLDVVTSAASAARAWTQPLHVGDLRLAEIRRVMHTSGHRAEFRGEGTLVIDGTVAVRKTSAGRVEVEKVGSDVAMMMRQRNSFAEVMRVVYDNLAVVAGV